MQKQKDDLSKSDVIAIVSSSTGLKKDDVKKVVDSTIETIMENVSRGKTIKFIGFATFSKKTRKARVMKNPAKPSELLDIPAKETPHIKIGKTFKERVEA